jgi:hypothetical protein
LRERDGQTEWSGTGQWEVISERRIATGYGYKGDYKLEREVKNRDDWVKSIKEGKVCLGL